MYLCIKWIGPSHLLLRGSSVKNTSLAVGIVVYTGKDTKLVKNNRVAPRYASLLLNYNRNTTTFIVKCLKLRRRWMYASTWSFSHNWWPVPSPLSPLWSGRTLTTRNYLICATKSLLRGIRSCGCLHAKIRRRITAISDTSSLSSFFTLTSSPSRYMSPSRWWITPKVTLIITVNIV